MTEQVLPKTEAEWRVRLTPAEFKVLRQGGTEAPFVGEYTDTKTKGTYHCRACGAKLFDSVDEVRLALRLAVVRRGDPGCDQVHRGPVARHGPSRDALRELRIRTWGTGSTASTTPTRTSGTASTRSA